MINDDDFLALVDEGDPVGETARCLVNGQFDHVPE